MSAIEQIGREFAISERVQQQVVRAVESTYPYANPDQSVAAYVRQLPLRIKPNVRTFAAAALAAVRSIDDPTKVYLPRHAAVFKAGVYVAFHAIRQEHGNHFADGLDPSLISGLYPRQIDPSRAVTDVESQAWLNGVAEDGLDIAPELALDVSKWSSIFDHIKDRPALFTTGFGVILALAKNKWQQQADVAFADLLTGSGIDVADWGEGSLHD